MNLYTAYLGAFEGLKPFKYDGRTRKVQVDICTQLAMLRRQHITRQVDGHLVTDAELARLKDCGEKRLK